MHSSPLTATTVATTTAKELHEPSRRADRVYQGLTIAVMLLLMGSLLMIW